ncbi:MAG: UDP-N-acetylmuramoyl-L-alanyl-D-glutamate--2,6-diaminopimelate ligase [Magnetococcus sp. DMHC-6]
MSQWIHPDPRQALALLAGQFYHHPGRQLEVIALTGTNGKTTIAAMLEAIYHALGANVGVIGTTGVRYYSTTDGVVNDPSPLTTPDPIALQHRLRQMVTAGCQAAILEASSHALDQRRLFGLPLAAAVFSNLSRDHLDYHGTLENYFAAKARLFTEMAPKVAIINQDDPYGGALLELCGTKTNVWSYGTTAARLSSMPKTTFTAHDIQLSWEKTSFTLTSPLGAFLVELAIPGGFNVYNALAAATTAFALGIPQTAIQLGLKQFRPVTGRMQKIQMGQDFTVVVDFAHTPDALENLLSSARKIQSSSKGRLLLVFGCGGDRDPGKRELMGQIAGRFADFTVITDDNPRSESPEAIRLAIVHGCQQVNGSCIQIGSRQEAIETALSMAKPFDVVLIAGKGHETVQITATGSLPFQDLAVVQEALGQYMIKGNLIGK